MPTSAGDVAHLLRRAGFGGSPSEVAALTSLSRAEIVDRLLDTSGAPPDVAPPAVGDPGVSDWDQYMALMTWWLDRMATTTTPLVEKMTLFWHGHFCTERRKVSNASLLHGQQRLERAEALGSLRAMTHAVALDPAMLQYLDNDTNRRGAPQENFARELWELFLLGAGQIYTESDIKESARAWTGHNLDRAGTTYVFYPDRHDAGAKTIFGQTAAWDGPQVIDLTFDGADTGAACARFLARKLWTFLAYPRPDAALVEELGQVFHGSGFHIATLVRAILLHDEFYSDRAKQGLVRSPIEFVVSVLRATGLTCATVNPQWYMAAMGQEPFNPPDVAGWKPNGYWISSTSFWARAGFARNVTWKARDAGIFAGIEQETPQAAVQMAFDRFGIDRPSAHTRATLEQWCQAQRPAATRWSIQPNLLTLTMLTPDFQLV